MKRFAALYRALDETTKTSRKVAALCDYFRDCAPLDGAWAAFFLGGRRLKRIVPHATLRSEAAVAASVGDWLFDECYEAVGDLAETIALLLPEGVAAEDRALSYWVENRIQPLASMTDAERRCELRRAWQELGTSERFLFNKLVTGSFRVGVSQRLVTR
ncbi:MAG: ATP-dependent DNA ligase, partial [Planctomycetales bacterium]|nr:ATP-dependent DNA ligase [Planctomycetales bacterium]